MSNAVAQNLNIHHLWKADAGWKEENSQLITDEVEEVICEMFAFLRTAGKQTE
ncbi:hypothetical protein VTO42DRAFT_7772 [Malbranchea cinnamomea]